MTIDDLITSLGIADDKKTAATASVHKFLDGDFVTKARFNEINEKNKTLTEQVEERDKQLKDIKKNVGDNEELKSQIEKLQADNKEQQKASDTKFKELQLSTAIKLAIADKAQDADIVSGLFDKNKLILGEDGKVTGLDEQLKTIKENKPFLFKDDSDNKPGAKYKPNGGAGGGSNNPFAKDTFNLTKQGEMLKADPDQAKSLAAEAGIEI